MTDRLPVATLPVGKRFVDCDLTNVDPNEGRHIKVTKNRVSELRINTGPCRRELDTLILPVYQALFVDMVNLEGFTPEDFNELNIQCFKRKVEKGSGAAYDFYRLERLGARAHKGSYIYFVVDVISRPVSDGDDNQQPEYVLRGISIPVPNLAPDYAWCNNPNNWFKFRDVLT